MNKLLREIIAFFLIIVFANILIDIGEEEKRFLVNPIKFFGVALVGGILGGFMSHWLNKRLEEKKNNI